MEEWPTTSVKADVNFPQLRRSTRASSERKSFSSGRASREIRETSAFQVVKDTVHQPSCRYSFRAFLTRLKIGILEAKKKPETSSSELGGKRKREESVRNPVREVVPSRFEKWRCLPHLPFLLCVVRSRESRSCDVIRKAFAINLKSANKGY